MKRLALVLLATYGLRLSLQSTRTIKRLEREAAAGNPRAINHFTQTRYARMLGPRNSDLGLIFYSAVAGAALTRALRRRTVFFGTLLASLTSVFGSIFLLWVLFVRLRVSCRICIKAHATNFAIFLILVTIKRKERRDGRSVSG
jgi:uncharacterized membrane protein